MGQGSNASSQPAPRIRAWPRRVGQWLARHWQRTTALLLAAVVAGSAAIATDTLGAGYAFSRVEAHIALFLDPPPDRATVETIDVTPEPTATASPLPTAVLVAGPTPSGATASPVVTPSPTPARVAVDVNLVKNPNAVFASEIKDIWCAPAGTTIVLTVLGHGDNTTAFQTTLAGQVKQWEAYSDSHDGGWGPAAIALALAAYGVPGYQVHAYTTLDVELQDAARAIDLTHEPVLLMAWYGAHTWVMTGYRAPADPTVFSDAKLTGAYILDPWYPRISTIWGRSAAPGAFHTRADLGVNILPWHRPEGHYPARDGKFIAVVPTMALPIGGSAASSAP